MTSLIRHKADILSWNYQVCCLLNTNTGDCTLHRCYNDTTSHWTVCQDISLYFYHWSGWSVVTAMVWSAQTQASMVTTPVSTVAFTFCHGVNILNWLTPDCADRGDPVSETSNLIFFIQPYRGNFLKANIVITTTILITTEKIVIVQTLCLKYRSVQLSSKCRCALFPDSFGV